MAPSEFLLEDSYERLEFGDEPESDGDDLENEEESLARRQGRKRFLEDIDSSLGPHPHSSLASQSLLPPTPLHPSLPPRPDASLCLSSKKQKKHNAAPKKIGMNPRKPDQSASNSCRHDRRQEHPRTLDKAKLKVKHITMATGNAYLLPVSSIIDLDSSVSKGGYIGKRSSEFKRLYSRDELCIEWGFSYCEWDGKLIVPLIDREGRIIGLLGGAPNDQTFEEDMKQLNLDFSNVDQSIKFTKQQASSRRGNISAVTMGYSFGGGQKVPQNFKLTKATRAALDKILEADNMRRLLGWTGSLYETYNDSSYTTTQTMKNTVEKKYSHIAPPSPCCSWTAFTYNSAYGGNAVTVPHVDFLNWAPGWCCISALGSFNADEEGHLVLWELKLVIRFPAGSSILIPSALIRHSNTPVTAGIRRSIIQYAAGGLYRYVDNGLITDKERFKQLNPAEKRAEIERRRHLWRAEIEKFHRIDLSKLPSLQ